MIYEFVRVVLGHKNLIDVLLSIQAAKKTGSLTVNFGQGSISSIEWQQKSGVQPGIWPFEKSSGASIDGKENLHSLSR
jgi:hypothetical protein